METLVAPQSSSESDSSDDGMSSAGESMELPHYKQDDQSNATNILNQVCLPELSISIFLLTVFHLYKVIW